MVQNLAQHPFSRTLFASPQDLLHAWADANNHGTAEDIIATFYGESLRFFKPTLEPAPIPPANAIHYFGRLKNLKNFGVTFHTTEITHPSEHEATATGAYTFHFTNDAEAREEIPAFFVFKMERLPGGWFLVEHISNRASNDG